MRSLVILLLLTVSANADTRYHLTLHVFFESGLKFIEAKETYSTYAKCIAAGDKKASRYRVTAIADCAPVHYFIDTGGKYT